MTSAHRNEAASFTFQGRNSIARCFLRNRLAVASLIVLVLIVMSCVLGPMFSRYTWQDQERENRFQPPCRTHWFGTDNLGRDIFVRVLMGGRVSLEVATVATGVAVFIGVLYGALAGFWGGRVDAVMMRFVDIMYSLPYAVFVIIVVTYFGRSLVLLFAAIGAVEWLTMARIIRGQILSLKRREFVEAAWATGLPWYRVLFRHMLPNTLGVIVVYTTLTAPRVILLEAFLSYLGLGTQEASWGTLIQDGVAAMEEYPWLLIFPSAALTLTLFALNALGDGLRDAFDPRNSSHP
ncbi:MAG TPA: ABC transporter permease [Candidatus Hydrogenedentes bacterium]|nr:ABC transporter permease [Candidatus Hydrogenedentota bacterium]HOL76558.1 ABC transporter permease [Candidatus Hydrogenedentota bacterium]HPO85221.1 ABC transporter permease [Candidatus Hydrogenedentota bacterium]